MPEEDPTPEPGAQAHAWTAANSAMGQTLTDQAAQQDLFLEELRKRRPDFTGGR